MVWSGPVCLWLLALSALPVHVEACGPRADIIRLLREDHQERQAAAGLSLSGRLFELWSSRDGVSWTLLRTGTDGVSCVVAAGRYWIEMPGSARPPL